MYHVKSINVWKWIDYFFERKTNIFNQKSAIINIFHQLLLIFLYFMFSIQGSDKKVHMNLIDFASVIYAKKDHQSGQYVHGSSISKP